MNYNRIIALVLILSLPTMFWGCDNKQSDTGKENAKLAHNHEISKENNNKVIDDKKLQNLTQPEIQNFENDSIPKNKIKEKHENLKPSCAACETLTSIKFFDLESNELVNEFNVIENNPYYNFDLPVLKIDEGAKQYDLKKLSVWGELEKYAKNLSEVERADVSTTLNYSKLFKFEHNQYVVVAYVFALVPAEYEFEDLTRFRSTFVTSYIVLNNKGQVVTILEDLPAVGDDVLITSDGRYLSLIYSENNHGFRIYDLKNDKLLIDYTMFTRGSAFSPNEKIIVFGGAGEQKRFKKAYFNIPQKTIYIDEFEISPSIYNIKDNGVLYPTKDGTKKIKLFKDFQQKIKL